MADTASLRDSLKAAIATVSSLAQRTYDTWPATAALPCAVVEPTTRRWETMNGAVQSQDFDVLVAVALRTYARAQDALDAYYSDSGASSVEAAIRASASLNVLRCAPRDYGVLSINGQDVLGFVLEVSLLTG